MRKPLTVAVAQPSCAPYDVAANATTHAAVVRAAGARVVVFPEMSLTGYEFDVAPVSTDDPRLDPLLAACAETGTLALAGAPVPGSTGVSIGILAVDGSGAALAYRKMWLGGDEPDQFVPGDAPAVLDVDDWRLGLAICKDTGVPRQAAETAALGVDAYVAGVLETPADAVVPAQRARRITAAHGVWVVIASFAGPAGSRYPRSPGGSAVWRPDGVAVAEAGAEPDALARATLS